ncbi:DUF1467 family protein [Pyruvatibacter sp. HU-CL02332]|uniref:DUF1467 family protein n=1 Tax=Pyruvatibacter sp. HU-CL02332 TaxID=3127650 RepID=UPI003104E89D
MSLAGGIAIFGLIWFLVLFAVLPFGVRTSAEAGDTLVEGAAESAPAKPQLLRKVLITTGISLAIWSVAFAVLEYRLIALDDVPFLPRFEEPK